MFGCDGVVVRTGQSLIEHGAVWVAPRDVCTVIRGPRPSLAVFSVELNRFSGVWNMGGNIIELQPTIKAWVISQRITRGIAQFEKSEWVGIGVGSGVTVVDIFNSPASAIRLYGAIVVSV